MPSVIDWSNKENFGLSDADLKASHDRYLQKNTRLRNSVGRENSNDDFLDAMAKYYEDKSREPIMVGEKRIEEIIRGL